MEYKIVTMPCNHVIKVEARTFEAAASSQMCWWNYGEVAFIFDENGKAEIFRKTKTKDGIFGHSDLIREDISNVE